MENQIQGVGDEALVDAAFERVKPELMALEADDLFPVSLDIPAGVATVLGVLPEARALRGQIEKDLPSFDLAHLDKLEDYALALSGAHAYYLAATQPPDSLDALNTEATRMRDTLQAEARALIQRGVVGEAQLEKLSGTKGYKNLASDLLLLKQVMQGVLPQLEGKTLMTAQDLETTSRLATRLLRVVGLREQGPARVAEATELRQRAFVKLLTAYQEVRDAVTYLRRSHGDVDEIVPGLHPGRPRKRVKEPGEGATAAAGASVPVGTIPATGGGGVAAPSGGVAVPSGAGAAGAGAAAASNGAATNGAVPGTAAKSSASGPFV